MALVPWGGSSATSFSEPSSSPFAPNGIIYANDVNVAIRVPSLVASAIWNTLNATDVNYQSSLTNAEDALSATVLACGMVYKSSLGAWVFPNKISFGDNATFDRGVEFSSAIVVDGTTALSSTLNVSGATTLSSTLTVDGATTLNSSLTVNGGAILTRSTSAQEALRIDVGRSIFEDQTIDNVKYSSSYTASHSFSLEEYYGSSLAPTYNTVINAESIRTPQITSSSLTVPFNSIYSSSGSESLEARLNRLGFKEGESGTDFTVPSDSPARNVRLRKLGKLVIFTVAVKIESISSSAQRITVPLITNIAEEFRPYRYPYGSSFQCTNHRETTQFIYFDVGFDADTNNTVDLRYQNTTGWLYDFESPIILSWFTEDPSNFQ